MVTANESVLIARLDRRLNEGPPYGIVTETADELAADLGAKRVALLLADYSGTTLERVEPGEWPSETESLPIEGTSAGVAQMEQRLVVEGEGSEWTVWAPVVIRGERLGVLEVVLSQVPDEETRQLLCQVAGTMAGAVVAARPYTDLFHRVRRRKELALAAELQWELLPVLECSTPDFWLAGGLEPAYEIAGDSFDYAVGPGRLSLAIIDGMGHGLGAALLATLVMAAVRNARRWNHGVADQAQGASQAVLEQFGGDKFVTALLIEIDRSNGQALAINAGHPPPVLVRRGRTTHVPLVPDLPLGLWPDLGYHVQRFQIAPGDRLVLVSDGVTEASSTGGEQFGVDRLACLVAE
ncbi:MAG: PP2C family protein-serine/threonine phosphatase, partial [Acidimicrobiales bacterium]